MLKQVSFVFFLLCSCYMGVESREWNHLTHKLEVKVPAEKAWKLYRNLVIVELAARELKHVIQSVDVRGNGGVGTLVKYNFVQGNSTYLERFIEIHDERRTKVVEGLHGGCLGVGCRRQSVQFHIIAKTSASCIIKSDIKYSVKKEFGADDPKPYIQLAADFAQIAKRLLEIKSAPTHG